MPMILRHSLTPAARTSSRSLFTKPNSSVYVSSLRMLSDQKESSGRIPFSHTKSTTNQNESSGSYMKFAAFGLLGFGGLAGAVWHVSDTTFLKGGRGGGGGRSFSGFGGRSSGFGNSSGYGRSAGSSASSGHSGSSGSSGSRPSGSESPGSKSPGSGSKPTSSGTSGSASPGSATPGSASSGSGHSSSSASSSSSSSSSSSWGPPWWWWWHPHCHHHGGCDCPHKHDKSSDEKPVDAAAKSSETKESAATESTAWIATWRRGAAGNGKKGDSVNSRRIDLPNIAETPKFEEICEELRCEGIRVEKEDWPSNIYVFSCDVDVDHKKVDKKLNDGVKKLLELENAAADHAKMLGLQ